MEKEKPERAWLCTACMEGHTNEDYTRCDGEIERAPKWGYKCWFCGLVHDKEYMARICCEESKEKHIERIVKEQEKKTKRWTI